MEQLVPSTQVLPEEYKVIQRIRDLWANHVDDDAIRELLIIDKDQWESLMRMMKEINLTEGDNRIAFEKYKARQNKRSQEIERLRLHAEGAEELSTAVKCFQLEHEIDKGLIEMGLKLSVLKGEVVETNVNVKHDIRLAALFAHLTPEQQAEAQAELNALTQAVLAEGIKLEDSGNAEGAKG